MQRRRKRLMAASPSNKPCGSRFSRARQTSANLIHVEIDDLRAVLHLLKRDGQRLGVIAFHDHALHGRNHSMMHAAATDYLESARARDVTPFADVDEIEVRRECQRLQATKAKSCVPGNTKMGQARRW